jgi:hypothetical protein
MCNAVRDNPERAEFIGYNPQRVRFIVFAVSAMFAGLAGGLHAINYEIVAAEAVSAQRSGVVLLMVYIGGVQHFRGRDPGRSRDHVAAGEPLRLHPPRGSSTWGSSSWPVVLYVPGGLRVLAKSQLRQLRVGSTRAASARLRARPGPGGRDHAGRRSCLSRWPTGARRSRGGSPHELFRITMDTATPWPWPRGSGGVGLERIAWRCVAAGSRTRAPCRPQGGARAETSASSYPASTKSFGATRIITRLSSRSPRASATRSSAKRRGPSRRSFNLISGRFAPTRIDSLHGAEIAGERPYRISRRGLSRSFQVTNIFTRMSVFENIRCAVLWSLGHRYNFWRSVEKLRDANERAEATLEQIRLAPRRDTLAGVLTYAEQRALEIGITIAGGADVILLDEPTAG